MPVEINSNSIGRHLFDLNVLLEENEIVVAENGNKDT